MSNSAKRHILVTGAGSGLGEATARLLARQGHALTLVGRRESRLQTVAAALAGQTEVHCQVCDIGDPGAIRKLFRSLSSRPPDGIAACAAQLLIKPFLDTSLDEFERVMEVNVRGVWLICQEAFRGMIGLGGGDIVLVSSLAGIRGLQIAPGKSVYAPSKHAVVGLTEALAFDGRPHNIRVNCVAPGYMKTEMNAQFGLHGGAHPDQVAPTIAFLLDRAQSGATTGTTIEVFCNDG
jgi:NAD(P)-dependent dehydrogenase (short-subunit alcohol dehydrogenase family)